MPNPIFQSHFAEKWLVGQTHRILNLCELKRTDKLKNSTAIYEYLFDLANNMIYNNLELQFPLRRINYEYVNYFGSR